MIDLDIQYVRTYYKTMSKPSLREDLLNAGLKVMFRSGYQGASVRDICAAAGAPQDNLTPPHMGQALLPLLSSALGKRSDNGRSSAPLRVSSPKARETCIVYGAR